MRILEGESAMPAHDCKMSAAVIGGDAREKEIIRLMSAAGIAVKAIGLPVEAAEYLGHAQETHVDDTVRGARAIVCPIPGMGQDESIYAPSWPEKLYLPLNTLRLACPGALLITGTASARLRQDCADAGIALREYEQDEELMILRSPAIAEGAVALAVENTDITIHGADIAVLGFGRMCMAVARLLLAMRAHVAVFARNPVQLARAKEMGAVPLHLSALDERLGDYAIIFNTIPVRIMDRDKVLRTDPDVLLMDLAAPPGGIDLEAARAAGRKTVWARGLGAYAPKTVGSTQWVGISRFLREDLGWEV